MIEIFKFFILPVVPTIIILGGQYYVAKHNLLVGRMERLSKDLERKFFDISKVYHRIRLFFTDRIHLFFTEMI